MRDSNAAYAAAGTALLLRRRWSIPLAIALAAPGTRRLAHTLPAPVAALTRSAFPFNREYMYLKGIACPTSSNPVPPPI